MPKYKVTASGWGPAELWSEPIEADSPDEAIEKVCPGREMVFGAVEIEPAPPPEGRIVMLWSQEWNPVEHKYEDFWHPRSDHEQENPGRKVRFTFDIPFEGEPAAVCERTIRDEITRTLLDRLSTIHPDITCTIDGIREVNPDGDGS